MNIHGNLQIRYAIGEKKRELIGIGDLKVEALVLLFRCLTQLVESKNNFDMFRLKRTLDIAVEKLLQDLIPSIPGGEVKSEKGEFSLRLRKGDLGNGEVETAGVSEAEFIKRDSGTRIGSDLSVSDLGKGGCGGETKKNENKQ